MLVALAVVLLTGNTSSSNLQPTTQPATVVVEGFSIGSIEKRIEELQQLIERQRNDLVQLQEQRKALRAQFREASGASFSSVDALHEQINRIEQERFGIELDRASREAKRVALAEHIAHMSEQMQKQSAADPVVRELQEIVSTREKRLADTRKRFEAGAASAAEVDEATAQLAQARAEFLDRKANAASLQSNVLNELNQELLRASIDSVEAETRAKLLQEKLTRLEQGLDFADRLEAIQDELQGIRERMHELRSELDRARFEAPLMNPSK